MFRRVARRPAVVFAVASLLFGSLLIALTPPLRGADEAAHVLRAYGLAQGEIVAATTDERGRKGLFLPAGPHRDFRFFEDAREGFMQNHGGYAARMAEFRRLERERAPLADEPPAFEPYSGSEGYSPIPYLPYSAAALAGRALGLDFATTLYAMRAAGLAASTAIIALAIACAPQLRWLFVLVAMLPSALFGRATVSADALALGTTLMASSLCLRAALGARTSSRARRLWFALSALCKPPQLAFILLEAMAHDWRHVSRWWRRAALVVTPAIALAVCWTLIGGTDSAGWRMVDDSDDGPEQFHPTWKLAFAFAHPLHFPAVLLGSADYVPELGRQLIGVLGWLDAPLRGWAYPLLAGLLIVASLQPLAANAAVRQRIATTALTVAILYALAVCFIFFLAYTPVASPRILGLQGRYFLGIAPLLAMAVAALLKREAPEGVARGAAILGAILSGVLAVDAVLQSDWRS